jgi:putative inorganic carbon (HCO3(-)) transporter
MEYPTQTGSQSSTVKVLLALVGLFVGAVIAVTSQSAVFSFVGVAIAGATFLLSDVAVIKRVLLAIIIIEIPLQLDVYLNHVPAVSATDAISGFNLSATTFCLIVLYGFWAIELAAGRVADSRVVIKMAIPAITYVTVAALSLQVAQDLGLGIYEINILVQAFLILLYVAQWVRTKEDVLFVVVLLLIGPVIQGLIALGLQRFGKPIDIGPISTRIVGARVAGTLGHPNSFGGYLALVLPVSLMLLVTPVGKAVKWLGAASFFLGTVALVLTQSRGAWIGYGISLALLGVFSYQSQWVPRRTLGLLSLAAVVPIAALLNIVAPRLGSFSDPAAQARLPLMQLALTMISDQPIRGVGANNYSTALPLYLTIDYSQAWISTVHNKYLLVWAETGLLGLAAFLVFLISAVRNGLRVWRTQDPFLAPLALGLSVGIVAVMVHMAVSLQHARAQVQLLWLVAGLLIAITRLAMRANAQRPAPRA